LAKQQYNIEDRKKIARKYEIEYRQRQVAIMTAQGITEVEIAAKLGVDNTTISRDIKALKLISQQFIYDITKSDFTFYYKQSLDLVKEVLRRQWEIIEKETLESTDLARWRILTEVLGTIEILNGYYNSAKQMHKSPIQRTMDEEHLGARPGTPIVKRSPEDELAELQEVESEWLKDLQEAEEKAKLTHSNYEVDEIKDELEGITEEMNALQERIREKQLRKQQRESKANK
jgi:hypothetical protein